MKYAFIIIVLSVFTFCNSCCRKSSGDPDSVNNKNVSELPRFQTKLKASDTLALNTDTLLYFQKSACFGFCPTYDYLVYQNGMIRYYGRQHVDILGPRYSLVTESWWKEISEQIKKINFFSLANVYPIEERMYIPDLPNTIIIIKEYGKRKSVTDNHDAPKELKDFEIFLEEKFKQVNFNQQF